MTADMLDRAAYLGNVTVPQLADVLPDGYDSVDVAAALTLADVGIKGAEAAKLLQAMRSYRAQL